MYSLEAFGAMIDDSVRMTAYEEALRRTVHGDSLVLDIGAGPGIMSLLAARMGARRVVAVEPNPLLRVGARLAVENGLADRIRFVHGRSQQLELAEKADVVVGDLRGGLPNVVSHIDALVDARRRLMKPGGVLIPLRDTVFAAPIQAEEQWAKLVSNWTGNVFGLKMSGAAEAILNQGLTSLDDIDRLLGEGKVLADFEYMAVESPNIDAALELIISAAGVVHGFSLWFETELVPGVGFSTAPDKEKTVYGRVFLPLSDPVLVAVGDRVTLAVKAVFEGGSPVWIWRGRVTKAEGARETSFSQSSVFFNPESPDVHEVFRGGASPVLSVDGGITRDVLVGVNGRRSVAEIVSNLRIDHPDRFECEEDALLFVRETLERFADSPFRVQD